MGNLSGFNANDIEPQTGSDPVPAGKYVAAMVASEKTATKKGDSHYLKCEFQILRGEYQNRRVWLNLNLWNQNQQAVQIAQGQLSQLCRCVGVATPNDSADLHNKPVGIKVKVRKSDEYGDSNDIQTFMRVEDVEHGQAQTAAAIGGDTAKAPWES